MFSVFTATVKQSFGMDLRLTVIENAAIVEPSNNGHTIAIILNPEVTPKSGEFDKRFVELNPGYQYLKENCPTPAERLRRLLATPSHKATSLNAINTISEQFPDEQIYLNISYSDLNVNQKQKFRNSLTNVEIIV